jgi:hypothetical protein
MTTYKNPYPDAAAMRRKYALHLLEQANNASPVQHPLQALARTLQGGLGGFYARQLAQEEQARRNVAGAPPPANVGIAREP